jgi:hypothetical protein
LLPIAGAERCYEPLKRGRFHAPVPHSADRRRRHGPSRRRRSRPRRQKTAEALRDKALLDRTAWDVTEDLTTTIGPRLVGSPAMARAKDWSVAKFKALGFTNVKVEEFAKPSWTRGEESAELVAPYPMKLSIVGLGRTVPTPAGGVEAEVALFKTYAELIAAPESAVRGKIVVITQPMVRAQDGAGYGVAGISRRTGPVEAAKRGAVGLLIRSISTSDSTVPHTGVTAFGDGVVSIPSAAWACRRPSNWSAWPPRARCASS